MALFISGRDISMFRNVNKELINKIIQTEVDYYKINLSTTKKSIYGDSGNKTYYMPVRLACLINREDIINTTDEVGVDTDQILTFAFLRDGILDEINLVPETGDIISWNESFYEVDNVNINQMISGKNDMVPMNVGKDFGANWSYICKTHMTRRNKLNIENVRFGSND